MWASPSNKPLLTPKPPFDWSGAVGHACRTTDAGFRWFRSRMEIEVGCSDRNGHDVGAMCAKLFYLPHALLLSDLNPGRKLAGRCEPPKKKSDQLPKHVQRLGRLYRGAVLNNNPDTRVALDKACFSEDFEEYGHRGLPFGGRVFLRGARQHSFPFPERDKWMTNCWTGVCQMKEGFPIISEGRFPMGVRRCGEILADFLPLFRTLMFSSTYYVFNLCTLGHCTSSQGSVRVSATPTRVGRENKRAFERAAANTLTYSSA